MQPFAKKPPTLYGAAMSHLPRSLCAWCVVRGEGWAAVLVAGREVVEGGGWDEPQQQHQRPTATDSDHHIPAARTYPARHEVVEFVAVVIIGAAREGRKDYVDEHAERHQNNRPETRERRADARARTVRVLVVEPVA